MPISIPKAPGNALNSLQYWDKASSYIPPMGKLATADLHACWSKDHLYLAVHTVGYVDDKLYAKTPGKGNLGPEWSFRFSDKGKFIRVPIGPGVKQQAAEELSGLKTKLFPSRTRYSAIVEVPANRFGKKSVCAGGCRDLGERCKGCGLDASDGLVGEVAVAR